MNRITTVALALSLFAAGTAVAGPPDTKPYKIYKTQGKYESVKQDIEIAITNRGLVVDHTSHIGKMLERTGKDLGLTQQVYGDAGSMQFCSAVVSRKTMEADPTNIAFCPYIIFYYTLPKDPNTVYVGYRRPLRADGTPASHAALQEVEKLLDGIVKDALFIN